MSNNIERGMYGQLAAERHLMEKGMPILARNYRISTGEIDLIAQDGEYIVFVEVKYRNSLHFGYPREAVHYRKQQRIKKTALYYIVQQKLTRQDFRFDVVEILNTGGQMQIEHIENAFA